MVKAKRFSRVQKPSSFHNLTLALKRKADASD